MFLSSNFSDLNHNNTISTREINRFKENIHWIDLNSQATYSVKTYTSFEDEEDQRDRNDNADSVFAIPLSKYQIYEKHFAGIYIDSMLVIKVSGHFI